MRERNKGLTAGILPVFLRPNKPESLTKVAEATPLNTLFSRRQKRMEVGRSRLWEMTRKSTVNKINYRLKSLSSALVRV